MNTKILNREAVAARAPSWQQIEVAGEHPARLGDAKLTQVVDAVAMEAMTEAFAAEAAVPGFEGMLVDADHLSHDPAQSTVAQAWLVDMQVRNGQLWGLLDWTDVGADAVRGRRYKYFSTEYDAGDMQDLGGGRWRPRRLAGLALTNRPNNRGGRPIKNRSGTGQMTTKNEEDDMNTIAEKLGLPEGATEEEILAEVEALLARVAEAQVAKDEAEVEEILNRLGDRLPEGGREPWREQLLANREATVKLLESLPVKVAPRVPITNRAVAGTPDADRATGGGGADAPALQQAAVLRIQNREGCSYVRAHDIARLEHPELF